jgi:hypothetical protein
MDRNLDAISVQIGLISSFWTVEIKGLNLYLTVLPEYREMIIGYARVSTVDHGLGLQEAALTKGLGLRGSPLGEALGHEHGRS